MSWRRALLIVAVVLAVVAGWLALREDSRVPSAREVVSARPFADDAPPRARAAETPTKITRRARVSKAERDAVHRRIVEALARRGDRGEERGAGSPEPGSPDAAPAAADASDPEEPRPRIRNRLGDDDGWGDAMTELLTDDFGPLADECIADARARVPDLAGMVAIGFTVVADEEIGGVVESAEPVAENEITDPGFLECMRESMLSTVLPPPPGSGRRDVVLSLRFEE